MSPGDLRKRNHSYSSEIQLANSGVKNSPGMI